MMPTANFDGDTFNMLEPSLVVSKRKRARIFNNLSMAEKNIARKRKRRLRKLDLL